MLLGPTIRAGLFVRSPAQAASSSWAFCWLHNAVFALLWSQKPVDDKNNEPVKRGGPTNVNKKFGETDGFDLLAEITHGSA